MRTLTSLVCLALLLLLCACASQSSTQAAGPSADQSGAPQASAQPAPRFLGAETSIMQPVTAPGYANVRSWRAPDFSPKDYSAIMLDPTIVWQAEAQAKGAGVKIEELNAVAGHFDEVLKKAMQAIEFPLRDQPGPRVLRVSAAITEARPSNPTMNTLTSVLPVGLLISLGTKAATGRDPNVGSCSIEMRFADAATGKTVALFSDHKEGDKYDRANFEKFGQAQKAEDEWAALMKDRILALWGARK